MPFKNNSTSFILLFHFGPELLKHSLSNSFQESESYMVPRLKHELASLGWSWLSPLLTRWQPQLWEPMAGTQGWVADGEGFATVLFLAGRKSLTKALVSLWLNWVTCQPPNYSLAEKNGIVWLRTTIGISVFMLNLFQFHPPSRKCSPSLNKSFPHICTKSWPFQLR